MLGGRWLAFNGWIVEHCDCNCVPTDCPARCLLSVGRSGNYIRCYFCGNLNIGRICHFGCKIEIWCCTCVRVANLCNLTNSASCRRLVSSTQLAENVSVSNLWPRNNQPDNMWSPFFCPAPLRKVKFKIFKSKSGFILKSTCASTLSILIQKQLCI